MKRRPKQFSVTKAVKRNARERVGNPPPEKVLPDERQKAARRAARHKQTLPGLLSDAASE